MKLSRLYLLIGIVAISLVFLYRIDLEGTNSGGESLAVITRYYGVTAEEIEQIITIPFEQSFSSIAGLEELNAYSEFSLSRIDMKLFASADGDEAIAAIREKTDRIYGSISSKYPAVQKPQVVTSGSDQQAVFSAALSLPGMTAVELRPIVENEIKPEYSRIPGLGEIDITGGSMPEIHVRVDTDKAAAYGFGSGAIASMIQASNTYSPCGSLDDGMSRIPVSLDARISVIEDLRSLPAAPGMKLSDIADITYSSRSPENINRYNSTEKVGIHIKSSSPNLIGISRKLALITATLEDRGYIIEVINDRGSELEASFRKIATALLIGIVFSTLLLFLFGIELKRLFFIAVGQPVIIVTAAGIAAAIGFLPDNYLLAGFALGIGMIIDSSLLITGALGEGLESFTAILKPLISSTLSTLIALLPIIPLKAEIPGLVSLVAALAIILAVSLFLAAAFLPGLYTPSRSPYKKMSIIILAKARRKVLRAALNLINPGRAFILCAILSLLGLISLTGLSMRIDRPLEDSVVFVHLELASGESMQSVDEKMSNLTRVVLGFLGVRAIQSVSRRGGGSMVINFDEKIIDAESLIDEIRDEGRNITGGFLYFPEGEGESKTRIRISVTGDDTAELKRTSRTALRRILQQPWAVEGVLHFKEDTPAYHFITDSESLYNAGITAAVAASFLRWNLQGPVADKWQAGGVERDLRVMSARNEALSSADLAALKLPQKDGASLRLDQLGVIIRAEESMRINRLNMQHSESFSIICRKDDPVKLNEQIWNELETMELPEGYTFIPSTKLIKKQAFYQRLWLQFGLALLLIILILCIERESFLQPFIIMMQLPPILAVPVILLKIIGAELGTETIIGLTLLAGMGINNGILIMDNIKVGIRTAVKFRFNGLFLTTATSVAGMVPLLFTGSTFFMNIAIVLMSGLTASFFIAVFVFPALLGYIIQKPIKKDPT